VDNEGTVISIVGFYLSLIGLLGSLFYLHLGNWLKQIGTTKEKWNQFKTRNDDKKIECYLEAYDEKSWQPLIGFVLLTIFMAIIVLFGEQIKSLLPLGTNVSFFLYYPMYIFFTIYLIASGLYIVKGYWTARGLYNEIDSKLKGG
jgi:hypothetical protein